MATTKKRGKRGVTVDDLRDAPQSAFLYCPECGERNSANYWDYSFHGRGDRPFVCQCGEIMILATESRTIRRIG
jgi:predicted RNA-binding Zn-ribbon protein involved in translation (DUF1610 family)